MVELAGEYQGQGTHPYHMHSEYVYTIVLHPKVYVRSFPVGNLTARRLKCVTHRKVEEHEWSDPNRTAITFFDPTDRDP